MATLLATRPTLLDVQRALDPDGTNAMVAEMMHKVNPMLDDIPMYEGNLQTGHQGTIRTGLPSPAWRLLNYPTTASKAKRANVIDTCGNLEAWGEIDEEVFILNGASTAFRLDEDRAHIEAMAQEIATTFFYGNTAVDPEKFLGLAPRFGLTTAENGGQIIDAAGTDTADEQTSIWVFAWDKATIHGIYPKGTKGGLDVQDLGVETSETTNGLMRVLRTKFNQKFGIHMRDWGGIVRIANIDTAVELPAGTVDLIDLLIQAYYKVPLRLRSTGRTVIYCNPTVKEALIKRALASDFTASATGTIAGGNALSVTQLESGEPMLRFWGIPIKECDAITNTEAVVS